MSFLTLALPKGRLFRPAVRLLGDLGLHIDLAETGSRLLVSEDPVRGMRFILLKPADVMTAVEYGAADMGIVGQDVVREQGGDVFEPLPLPFGYCRLVLAGPSASRAAAWWLNSSLRVATKYPRLTRRYFSERGWSAETITLSGSVEIAPALGLSDVLVDIVDTGRTLRENGLVEYQPLMKSQATLIVNRAAFTLRGGEIRALIDALRRHGAEFERKDKHAAGKN